MSHLNDSSLRKNGKTVYGHLMQIWLAFIKRLIAQQQLFNFNLKIFTDMIRNRFNPHGPFVPLGDIFPFWAKILNVFTLTCYHFCKLLSQPKSRPWFLVLSLDRTTVNKKTKYEKGKNRGPWELSPSWSSVSFSYLFFSSWKSLSAIWEIFN